MSGSLIPDAFFDQGVDFISSFHVIDHCGFIDAMTNEHNMDYSFITGQKQYLMMNPSTTDGKPGAEDNFTQALLKTLL